MVLILLALAGSAFHSDQPTRYFLAPTIALKPEITRAFTFDFDDELSDDTLFQSLSKEGFPVSYHRRLKASVCFDDKCRLLDVAIYWNTTGRYLGFELPEKEYLSKSDHEPFTAEEYQRLNALLADAQSPLRNLSYEELVPKPRFAVKGVDAVSSATAKSVLDYIVKGAAYTTYKMWHFIYGPTQDQVINLTKKALSAELILKILESSDPSDRLWALDHINGFIKPNPALTARLLGFISNENYSFSERAIRAIGATDLQSDSLQIALLGKFNQADYSQRKLLLAKLKDAPFLNEKVRDGLAGQLQNLNGELVGDVLAIYTKLAIKDPQTCKSVMKLLQLENRFISQKALKFLEETGTSNPAILKEIATYKANKQ
ncbi:hypothetical protein [Dyadobacter aurulentus]|uniref:hypothetical protein n=1 Tax=Dyadobacter sp. UC 10 TaxID=2605428 RepID=UPI0011F12E8B|nr:hypothetical protein [Dyadobacter sp. UC 10]KAA0992792.1 hypothetical protein FXO21_22745 [Dyadobacter sp. UC 10]